MSERTASPEKTIITDLSDTHPQLAHAPQEAMATDGEHWRQTIEHLKTRTRSDASAEFIVLDTASNILTTTGLRLHATQRAPLDNWAKFYWYTGDNTSIYWRHEVRFDFRWQNTSDRPVVINTLGSLSFHGTCEAVANRPALFDERWSDMHIYGRLDINELWGGPIRQASQSARVMYLSAYIAPVDDTDVQRERVDTGVSVWYDGYQVPPQGIAWILLSCRMLANTRKGSARFDFRDTYDPAHKVQAPVVGIAVHSM